jgi:hypothetical protein
MWKKPETALGILRETFKSPFAWLLAIFPALSAYSVFQERLDPDLLSLLGIMPLPYWIICFLLILLLASFHTSYRLVCATRPTLLVQVHRLLNKRRTQGFDIRKKALAGWQDSAEDWFQTVLVDLSLIRDPEFSRLFELDIGRKQGIKDLPSGKRNPKNLINFVCQELETLQREITSDQIPQDSDDLRARIKAALTPS